MYYCIMGRVHRLKSIQILPLQIEEAWKFFSDPRNLLTITPTNLNLKMSSDLFGEEVYGGQVMTYTVRPLFGIAVSWMTEITYVERLKFFIDEQRKGPFRLWHHQHHFKQLNDGVEMTDLVHYRLPLGFVGDLAHLIVARKLREIFSFRHDQTESLFGKKEGTPWQLEMEG